MLRIFKYPAAWAAFAVLFYGLIIALKVSPYVGGSDSSGYYNSARLLAEGKVSMAQRIIPGLPVSPDILEPSVYLPLGFLPRPAGQMVPGYPVGLPLLMTVTALLVGWNAVAGWLAGWNMLLGIILTNLLGRECGLPRGWSWFSCWIIALSPLYTAMGLQPMSDVPAMTWCTAAVLFALKSEGRPRWGILCGFSLALAVLIRPTNMLILIPVALSLQSEVKRWLWVIAGGLPGALFLGFYNHALYGQVLTTGYGNMSEAFSTAWIIPTLNHYGHWLPRLFTPFIILSAGLPWSRAKRPVVVVLASWIIPILVFYCFYEFTHEVWWYLRFIVPAAPAMAIASALVLKRIAGHYNCGLFELSAPGRALLITFLIIVISALCNGFGLRSLHALDGKKGDKSYWSVAQWLQQNAAGNSVIATMQNSGSLIAYSPFAIVRWDALTEENFPRILRQLAANQQPLYAALFPFEEADAFARMPGSWKQVAKITPASIWQYHQPDAGFP